MFYISNKQTNNSGTFFNHKTSAVGLVKNYKRPFQECQSVRSHINFLSIKASTIFQIGENVDRNQSKTILTITLYINRPN